MRVRYFTLFVIAIAIATIWLTLAAWTAPYILTGSYSDGTLGWEMHERRTIIGGYDSFRTVRYYPTGELMFATETPGDGNSGTYWKKDGTIYLNRAAWALDHADLMFDCVPDGDRPSFPMLDWISSLYR